MKKSISIMMVCMMTVTTLSGCVSKSDYDALEERVSNLEQQINSNQTNDNSTIENESEEPEDVTTTESQVPEAVNIIWSLDGMTSEEIVDLIIEYTDIPDEGTTVEEYRSRFSVEPYSSEDATLLCYFDGTIDGVVYASSYVNSVSNNFEYNMDGSIHVDGAWHPNSQIYVVVDDYDTAVAIYNALHPIVLENYEVFEDVSEGTEWYVNTINEGSYNYYTLRLSYEENYQNGSSRYVIGYTNYIL